MEITQELLDKYYLNQCTPEERDAVERWLAEEEEDAALPPHIDTRQLAEQGWTNFTSRHPEVRGRTGRPIWTIRRYVALAACLLLAGTLFFYFNSRPIDPTSPARLLSYSTAPGKKATLILPDGTRIQLNSGSTLHYPEHFDDTLRFIRLSGEAFFEVADDSRKPFVIETEHSIIQVLGTAFNLREYADEQTTTVVVTEGKVSLSGKQDMRQRLVLSPNQLGSLGKSQHLNLQPVITDAHIAWKDNRLILADQTLGDIALTLERWYGVKFSISSDELMLQRYTGEFDNPSLQSVLKSLAFAIRFNYRISDHSVTITP